MNKYILTLLLPATLSDEQLNEVREKIEELIVKFNGQISETKELSRRRLAYVIKKIRNGIYVNAFFELGGDRVANLSKELKLMPEVVRFMITKFEEKKIIHQAAESALVDKTKKTTSQKIEARERKEINMEDLDKKIDEILEENSVEV